MSLLQDVQNAAIDATVPISTLLRNCAVLAARLNHEELQLWVSQELNGYQSPDDVPDYRVVPANATGNLSGPFNSGYTNVTIPPILLPDWGRRFAEEVRFTHPIAAIEDFGKGDSITCPWPGNLLMYMQTEGNKFANGMILYGAWQTVARASVVGIVDTVRNRVLQFALSLEKEAPAAGERDKPGSAVSEARVNQLFQTIIHGDVIGNLATGSHAVQTTGAISVSQGDLEALRKTLAEWGVPADEVKALEAAIAQDGPATSLAERPKTRAWLASLVSKVLAGGLKLSKDISIDLIAQAVGQFLGIPHVPSL